MNTKETEMMSKVEFATTTRAVGGELISSSNQATHVGVVRSVSGNSPHIAERLSAMFGLPLDCLSSSLAWLARSSRAPSNPSPSSVLFSWLSAPA